MLLLCCLIRSKRVRRQVIRIDVLPDDVLLEIFDFHTKIDVFLYKEQTEAWQTLVHVCRRWRNLILGSPRRLNLKLFCRPKTPIKDKLDVWPAFPLVVSTNAESGTDNLIAALRQNNRVCEVRLWGLTDQKSAEVLAAMRAPFPELTKLSLWTDGSTVPVIPDSFLGGSAPQMRDFFLDGFSFPKLPNLLLSATHLVELDLYEIPHSGYISPEAMVDLISVLPSLDKLTLRFRYPQSGPHWETQLPPPSKCFVGPALTYLNFKGVTEYLEDLVTFIDTPQLVKMDITFFNQIDFDIPRLAQFINRMTKVWKPDAHLKFDDFRSRVVLYQLYPGSGTLEIGISCEEPDWQISSIEQVCNSSLHPLFTVEVLYIEHQYRRLVWKNDAIENTLWLQLLLPFTAVKNLYLSKEFAPGIAAVLHELVGGRITEVLPSLQNIFVEGLEPSGLGHFQESIRQFVSARKLSDHIITVSHWNPDGR